KKLKQERDDQVRDQARLSRNSKYILAPTSGHAIHQDNPVLVARAIEEVLDAVSKGVPMKQ
ncbi:MAG TPA: alpha/beta hydrolase, partial [Anaerolineales bacterium]|nr:alpha/beta hydrolase [Anaerolineales bacterium]